MSTPDEVAVRLEIEQRRKRRKQPERVIAYVIDQFMQRLGKPEVVWYHIPNGGLRNPRTGASLKRQGAKAGVPDFYFLYDGQSYYLELKTEVGRLSPAQKAMQMRLFRAGAKICNAFGVDEAVDAIRRWNLIKDGMEPS